MKRLTAISLFVIGLSLSRQVQAQGMLEVSNLGQTPTGSAAVDNGSWIAQTFITGNNPVGYTLNSIQLLMDAASGSPGGFNVSIYSKTGDPHSFTSPGDTVHSSLGSLSGPDPSAGGLFTYTTSGISLLPSVFYFVVVTAGTPVSQGSYDWSAANSFTPNPATSWTIDDTYFSSSNGSTWTGHLRQNVFQMALYTTPMPEPGTLALAGFGLACLSFCRRRD
jgi:hypothetical protein